MLKESNQKFKNGNPTVLYHLGLAYEKTGDRALAKEAFTKALALSQNFHEAKEAQKALEEIHAVSR